MSPHHILTRAHTAANGVLVLTAAEARTLAPVAGLCFDLMLITPGSRIEPGGELRISLFGHGVLAQIAERDQMPAWPGG
mgnify:CR=1 FL=1